ncbi:hypothetical protein A3G67_00640 [Candidatus Roizmanbacteria bacterium RIFCSPLOWO2_12_FULL_40_12]|uniref:Type 4 fimbrial biogenesis protein PilX N-terminal domain-containing protein n=1 Tax=Candidatus Roizmanbacteria bacterium RIFCSPLOWO2_01_FULL_40_42 TaxID=1802066 RepID=A0A1F7J682_9BACT|nr:MAG: hypothetical protein A2779_02120 [Candidatus Roizmanbacteria bacterium RIFCSPHIGHO2_01_FULL_40_98]OGK28786.1 MAG: hypothetical protein A3C31_04040 [Candidatus Roizmanbacteria bacterium RIFCSPHIGHO2_02_FULL_40_53]OGK29644.1 MAG: hypothetical protein A2W49_00435 [Candidatus Roizmanbacteria bacterium RIFCSPHIGHO2_12_41_18]OGK36321.1 MAG: hypothetical protein A3E69_02745 [Candidatus Roizmanbacteria bacterium RIFCSPHIGHO2_12_FULL_40_130]OGK51127.1 MAG: hypothetical protein A3B50_05015 [Candi
MKRFKLQASSKRESGQVLLIAVMLLAVTLTIVLSITFSSRTDTQITKLEEENQKALAAAEAGIEAALKTAGTVNIGQAGTGGILPNSGFSGTASVSTNPSDTKFTTPILQKDEQYTFYMGVYTAPSTIGPSDGENLEICFASSNQSTKSAIEITVVKGTSPNYTLRRFVIDPDDRISESDQGLACSNTAFYKGTTIDGSLIGEDTKLVIVRMLYSSSKVFFSRNSPDLPSQGKFVSSEATSDTGVSKKVQLFQSYPQLPADFFVTGF